MNSKQSFSIILIVAIIIVVLYSCKDIGTGLPPLSGLSASSTNVSIVKGTSKQITVSGGISPYSIKRQPDAAKATVSLASSILTISGIDTGSTNTIVADSKIPIADSLEIIISILGTLPLVSFSNQIQPIFNSQCTGCHGGTGGLTITAGVSYNNLVNVFAQSSCTSLKRVLPNDADNSVLYKKVSGTTCGNQMPQGGALSTSDIALIRDWINQGAKNN
jgi:Cytochrome c.